VPCWATTIHKFQGFEAGPDKKDMFRYLMCDPGDMKWEQSTPGALYVALSRAKTTDAIYWIGSGMCIQRILEGGLKKGHGTGNAKMVCELISKRNLWVNFLESRSKRTPTIKYSKKQLKRMERTKYTQQQIMRCICDIITNPNEKWSALWKKKYLIPKTFFGSS